MPTVLLPMSGSRDDVEPFCHLGVALAGRGHGVRLVTHERFRSLALSDGVVQGLVHRLVPYRSTQLSDEWQNFAFNLQPWAQQFLDRHPELLEPEVTILRQQLISQGR